MRRTITLFALLLWGGATAALFGQQSARPALKHFQEKYAELGLEAADVAHLEVTDDYRSADGTQHVYLRQLVNGLPVFNAQAALHYRGTRVIHRTSDLAKGVAEVPTPAFTLSAQAAAATAANTVAAAFGNPVPLGFEGDEDLFAWPSLSDRPLRVSRGYFATSGGELRLAYQVVIDRYDASSDYWSVWLDAADGRVLAEHNHVQKCSFGGRAHYHATAHDHAAKATETAPALNAGVADGSAYRVFAFGLESPIHGERTLEVEPADPEASPFGWHDTNGQPGPEHTTTRGNNVYAYPDVDDNNTPDAGNPAQGGDSLVFDFYYAADETLDTLLPASVTQLFYTTSAIHDWLHHAGFDEAAGNFQRRNYTDDGEDRDHVLAEAQDGATLNDGEHDSNANFFTPPDGSSPRMQMYKWSRTSLSVMTATSPESAAGPYRTGLANFGGVIDETPLTGQVVYSDPVDACDPLSDVVADRVALITRGTCEFGSKILAAERAGAIAAIICNDAAEGDPDGRGGTVLMGAGADGGAVTIPAVFLSRENCVPLRTAIEAGDSVSVTFQDVSPPPIDGTFDNGIVAHEIGHGVSNRLIGGPNNANCMGNDEQMGEGWSDFFTLAASPFALSAAPDGTEQRGIGTFAAGQNTNGRGIRRLPYTTDMSVNGYTYDDVLFSGTAPHPLGEIWATTLWDLYWTMVEDYGFDEDLYTGTGGNNLAVQLVVEGLKYTKCRPGMADGRDGILAADEALNDGANVCRIWEVFARRGLGASANQAGTDSRLDGREAFDMPPSCIGGVQLTKRADRTSVAPGDEVTFTLRATSYREEPAPNVVISDELPAGLTVDQGSVAGAESFNVEDGRIVLRVGDLDPLESQTVRYTATVGEAFSEVVFFDGVEDEDDDRWLQVDNTVIDPAAPPEFDAFWERTDTTPFRGGFAWYVVNVAFAQNQALQLIDPVRLTGSNPSLRFFTKYDTEPGWDAGIVEVSTDAVNWQRVEEDLVRGGYRGEISPNGTEALLNTTSFWGMSDDYEEIIVDLSDYAGSEVYVRFNFYSDVAARGRGWWVDNIRFLNNTVSYDPVATVTSDAGDNFTTTIGDLGVLVLSDEVISNTDDPQLGRTAVNVFPNPATEVINVKVTAERAGTSTVELFDIAGRLLDSRTLRLAPGRTDTTFPAERLPAGVYVVRVTGQELVSTTKVTVN